MKKIPSIIIAVLLCFSLVVFFPPVMASNDSWSKPRPTRDRDFGDTIGNVTADNSARVGLGVTISHYHETDAHYLYLNLSVSANSREGIYYNHNQVFDNCWYDVSTDINIAEDDGGCRISIPENVGPILFYGVTYTSIWVCRNGFVSFDHSNRNDSVCQSIPSTDAPRALIAPFWRDLKTGGSMKWGIVIANSGYGGLAFVVTWENVPDAQGNFQTFQVVFEKWANGASDDSHHIIYFHYKTVTKTVPTSIGIESQEGNRGYFIDTNSIYNGYCVRFYAPSGCQLKQLSIRATKNDQAATISFLGGETGGENVELGTGNMNGLGYVDAIAYVADLMLLTSPQTTGIVACEFLIYGYDAYRVADTLSPALYTGNGSATQSDSEAYIYAAAVQEGYDPTPPRPFDATLATKISWNFHDENDSPHELTIIAEATYQNIDDSNEWMVSTSVTLGMSLGEHYLDVSSTSGGTINPSPGNYIKTSGSSVTAWASASEGYLFSNWFLDGIAYHVNPMNFVMDSDHVLHAQFKKTHTLVISVPSPTQGTTNPTPGSYSYSEDDIISVTAKANSGYAFDHWLLDGEENLAINISVSMGADHTLAAYFRHVNSPPNAPSTPSGSQTGQIYTTLSYSTRAIDPDADQVRYNFSWGNGEYNLTELRPSNVSTSIAHVWSRSGTYNVSVEAQDIYGLWGDWSLPLPVTITQNDAGSGGDAGNNQSLAVSINSSVYYAGTLYSSNPSDSEDWYKFYVINGQHIYFSMTPPTGANFGLELHDPAGYLVAQGAGGPGVTKWVAYDSDRPPGCWGVRVCVSGGTDGRYSFRLTFQNDANCGRDAGDTLANATYINSSPFNYNGTLYSCNPNDTDDWYKFYAQTGQNIYMSVTPPAGVDFHLQLYNPAGTYIPGEHDNGAGLTDWISFDANSTGNWSIRTYMCNNETVEMRYEFMLSVESGVGGDGCPTLFVWNGSCYLNYGVINIHNPSGEDVVREVVVSAADMGVSNYEAGFVLREGWPGLNFSESTIDQVKLYAVDIYGNRHLCPLISSTHSSLGNVLPQLLFSDNWKVQSYSLETISLTFIVPYPQRYIQGYLFKIEGCNMLKM